MVFSGVMVSWKVSLELHRRKSGIGPPQLFSCALASSIRMSRALGFFWRKPNRSTNSRQTCVGVFSSMY